MPKVQPEIRKGSPRARLPNIDSGEREIDFRPLSYRIPLCRCEAAPRLLLITNSNSHTLFRLVPRSTTLDDLERSLRTLFHNWVSWWRND